MLENLGRSLQEKQHWMVALLVLGVGVLVYRVLQEDGWSVDVEKKEGMDALQQAHAGRWLSVPDSSTQTMNNSTSGRAEAASYLTRAGEGFSGMSDVGPSYWGPEEAARSAQLAKGNSKAEGMRGRVAVDYMSDGNVLKAGDVPPLPY